MTHHLFNTDNLPELHKFPDKYFKFAVLDPPYGLDTRLTNGNKNSSVGKSFAHYKSQWDIKPPPEFWKQIFRISEIQVVCGANYFDLPPSRGIIAWDKDQYMPSLSAWELIWTSLDKPAKIFKKRSQDPDRFHPTQKPIELYDFIFDYIGAQQGDKVLDTHFGSASSVISAIENNLEITAYESDPITFNDAKNRITNHFAQLNAFRATPIINYQSFFCRKNLHHPEKYTEQCSECIKDQRWEYNIPLI
jgi:site-specific DNA-methyltransferase (adenine-specific)